MKKILYFLLSVYVFILPIIPTKVMKKINFKNVAGLDLFLLIIFMVYFTSIIFSKDSRNNFVKGVKDFFTNPLTLLIMLLAVIMAASIMWSYDKNMAIKETFRFVTYIVLFFIIKYELNSRKQIKGLIITSFSSAIIVCILGIIQFFQGTAANNRITSTMDNSNNLAAFLILLIFPIIMITIYERKSKNLIAYALVTLLFFIALLMTGSRNSLIGLGVGLIILAIIYNKKLLVLFAGLGGISLFIPQIWSRVKGIFDYTQNDSRVRLWKTAIKMIEDHPLLGVGNGNYVSVYQEYIKKFPELEYVDHKISASHNSYLKVQSELGIIGECTFIAVLLTAFFRIRNTAKLLEYSYYKFFSIGFTAAMVSFYLMNMFDNLFFVPKTTTFFWVFVGIIEALNYKKCDDRDNGLFFTRS